MTKGKAFTEGAVFVNGRFLPPPYVVERWGTGLRINGKKVSGQIVDWNDFLRTQKSVRPVSSSVTRSAALVIDERLAASSIDDVNASSLDDLFDDDPNPAKSPEVKPPVASRVTVPAIAAPARTVEPTPTLTLDGKFVHNEASKRLLDRVNAARTEIDRILRAGGFIFVGDRYSRVTGDGRALAKMLEVLPELMKRADTIESFRAGVRAANLVYLNEVLCEDLFRNRYCYRQLQEYRAKLEKERKWKTMLDDVKNPMF